MVTTRLSTILLWMIGKDFRKNFTLENVLLRYGKMKTTNIFQIMFSSIVSGLTSKNWLKMHKLDFWDFEKWTMIKPKYPKTVIGNTLPKTYLHYSHCSRDWNQNRSITYHYKIFVLGTGFYLSQNNIMELENFPKESHYNKQVFLIFHC